MRRAHSRKKPIKHRFDRLKHYTVAENGCWAWKGGTDGPKGYGFIQLYTDHSGIKAHRYFYEHHKGPVPKGLVIDHLCRNHGCVNPDHLEVVTNQENIRRDVSAKVLKTHCPSGHVYDYFWITKAGRHTRGCKTCRARHGKNHRDNIGRPLKVSPKQAAQMKAMRKAGIPVQNISAKFGVSNSAVYQHTN